MKKWIEWLKQIPRRFVRLIQRKRKTLIKWGIIIGIVLIGCYFLGYSMNCFVKAEFRLKYEPILLLHDDTFLYAGLFFAITVFIALLYYYSNYWIFNSKNIIKGRARDKHIHANLEQARY